MPAEFDWKKWEDYITTQKSTERQMWVVAVLAPESIIRSGKFGRIEIPATEKLKHFPGMLERVDQAFIQRVNFVDEDIRDAHEKDLIGDSEDCIYTWADVINECLALGRTDGTEPAPDPRVFAQPTYRGIYAKRVAMAGVVTPDALTHNSVWTTCHYRYCVNQRHLKLGEAPVAWRGKPKKK